MATKTACEIMVTIEEYPHISYWFTLRQAVEKLEESTLEAHGKSSLPRALLVFDEQKRLLGIVRRRDILRGLEPKFLRTMSIHHRRELFNIEIDANLVDLSMGKIAHEMQTQAETPISEVMQPIVATVRHDDHLAKIIYKMLNRDVNLLPILKDDKIIGVIRSVDVFREIALMLHEKLPQ